MPTPLVAFVAGATGYTGQHVVAALRATLARVGPDHVFALLGTTRRRAVACGSAPRFTYLSAMGANHTSASKYVAVRGRMERALREGRLVAGVARLRAAAGGAR